MKKPLPVGLIVEGNATGSVVLRLPGIAAEIGPVKSTALRVARRFSNAFRAGYAVTEYESMQGTRLVLVRVPDASLPRVIQEIALSGLNLRRMCFAFCETWICSDMMGELRAAGASVGTLVAVPGTAPHWFLAEGDGPALRELRRLLALSRARVLPLRLGTKPLYFAAELLATTIPIQFYQAAETALRQAGVSGNILASVLDQLAHRMMKNFKGGKQSSWGGPLAAASKAIVDSHLANVRLLSPKVSELLDRHVSLLQGNALPPNTV